MLVHYTLPILGSVAGTTQGKIEHRQNMSASQGCSIRWKLTLSNAMVRRRRRRSSLEALEQNDEKLLG
jgi:hypothetical protein